MESKNPICKLFSSNLPLLNPVLIRNRKKGGILNLAPVVKRIGILLLVLISFNSFVNAATFTISVNTNWSAIAGGPPLATDNIIITNGAILTVDVANAVCASVQIGIGSGNGVLVFNAGSQLTVGGAVTLGNGAITGTLTMTLGGTLICNSLILTGGAFNQGIGTIQLNATNTLPGTIFLTFYNLIINSGTTTLGRNIAVSNILTVKAGATVDISTFTLTPSAVTMEIGSTGALITGTGSLALAGNVTVNSTAGSSGATISAPVALGAVRTFTVADDGSTAIDLTISGIISGAGGVTKAGVGTMALSAANSYAGAVTISAGILSANTLANAATNSSLGNGNTTPAISIAGAGTLQYTGTGHSTSRAITLTGTNATIDASGTGTMTLSGNVGGATFNLNITGTGNGVESGIIGTTTGKVTKNGTGYWTLSGVNTFSGAVTINSGILSVNTLANAATNSPLGNGNTTPAISIAGAGTLQYTGTGHSSSRAITLTGSGATIDASGTGTMTLSGNVGGNTFNLKLTGSGAGVESGVIGTTSGNVTKNGTGAWTLSNTNTFTGGVTLNAGNLNINQTQALGTVAGTFAINGGTIDNTTAAAITTLNYPLTWNGDFTFTGTRNLNLGTGAVTIGADRQVTVAANTLTVGGVISAAAFNLTKAGTGTLTLGTNTVTLKGLNISAGTFTAPSTTLNLAGDFSNSGTFTHNGGTVNFNGSVVQAIGGSAATAFNNLILNNAAGFTLSGGVTIGNTMTMTLGNIATGANTLLLSNTTSAALVHAAGGGTIVGTFQRAIGSTATQYLFPVGTSTSYNPLKITFSNLTTGTLAVLFQPNDIGTAGLPLTGVYDRQTEGYWTMTAIAPMATTNYDVNLNYTGFSGVDANSRIIKRTNGGNLFLDGTHGTVISPEITRTGLNGISTGTTDLAIGKANAVITTQPFPYSGCNATFSVVVSGQAPLSYQWQENNGGGFVNITNGGVYSGATSSSVTITGATVLMNGFQYRCIITDGFLYSVTSNSATLTVNPPPVVTLGYSYSRDIILNAASGSSDLTDFPALISITLPELKTIPNLGHVSNANGYDIIFTDQSGNKLDHQIESYDGLAGQFIGWVRIPILSHTASTTIKMLYGNSSVSVNPSLKSVWASNYKGVWHLNGTDYTDATSTGNNGTENATSNVAGRIAGGRSFNGSTSYISVTTSGFVPNNNNQTISIWANYSTVPAGSQNLISFQNTVAGSAIQLGFRGGDAVAWKWGGTLLADAGAAPSANVWHFYVYTFDGTTSRIYVDGVEKNNSIIAPQTALPSEGNIGRYNNGEYVAASLDEPRFSMSPKSADWILTEYNNQNNPGAFTTVGAENANNELASVGVCATTYTLDQGTPTGGTYSGPGVTGTNFNASVAGVGTKTINYSYTNGGGCTNSANENIIVTAVPTPPVASNQVCCISNIVDLVAAGTNLRWYTDPALTVLAGTGTPFATGRTAAGVYTYYVTQTLNGCESTATTVTLTVFSGITIDAQPQPVSICASGNAIFTVATSGFNLSYQWQENGSNISNGGIYSGATTATLTLTSPGVGQDGNAYRCVISSTCGALPVNSNAALLTFKPLPSPTISGSISTCPFETGVTYSTPLVSGNIYAWVVTGGTISGSSTGNSVVINWGGLGTGTLTVTESVNLSCSTTTPPYNVTITDVTPPVISGCPGDINVNNGTGVCSATVSWTEPTATDDCVGAMTYTTRNHAPGDVFPVGTTMVTYTFTDLASNTSTCSFNVTVSDNTAPVISGCPANINVNNVPGACATVAFWTEPTAVDNCTPAGSIIWTKSHLPGDLFPVGTTTVTYTAKDAANNVSTCSFTVTVNDNQPPTALCKNISVYLDGLGNATITPAQVDNGSTDNCGISSMSVVPNTFNTSNIGTNTVTLTVNDVNGNNSTCTSTVTIIGTIPPTAYYSYQTGNWDQASTWTFDPGGTTGPGSTVPGNNDKVVILTGRTVTLPSNVTSQNLDITINSGGILDQSTFAFTDAAGLAALRGGGVLKLSSPAFPITVINTFVTSDAGTTEYNNNGLMSATQSVYYNLTIRTAGTVTQVNNITLGGNLDVKLGTFRINDATARRLSLIINGDVTVDNGGLIGIGTGITNTVTTPVTGINGSTGGFLNYYELQSHRVQVQGNFTNNGIVKFSNLNNPVYDQFPSNGFATVYFQGSNDKLLNCNGQTDFYNLIVDKGTDQTYKLTIYSAGYNKFRLFGANTSNGDNAAPATTADPNLKKALWIKNGTLVLQGLLVIPSLSEGATAGPPSSDFTIPSKGSLLLDGAGVIVLSTADDFTEVNAAYGIAGGSNIAYGINASGGNSGISILGKLQLNNGYLSTRESTGLNYWSYASGQFILNGGTIDTKQFHNPEGGAVGLVSYIQNGGNVILRGRFKDAINYVNPADLANPVINTARAVNGIDASAGIGTFSISSNAANAFAMAGGTLSVYDVCNTTATPLAFYVNCPVSNINVTGGTVQIIPTAGSVLADANYLINSTASIYNLILNRVSGVTSVQLNTNPLVIKNDLTLTSGVFVANNQDVTVGGNYSIASGTTYTTGTNATIFNGGSTQTFTVNLAAPLSLYKLTIDKPAGITLNLAGSQTILNVTNNFRLVLGTANDNGKTINVAGNVFNSGIHTGSGLGKISLNGTLPQTIDGNGIFRNLELNNTNAAQAPVSLIANMTINGLLTFSQDKLFNINTNNLTLNSSALIVNSSALRYIQTAGNSGDGGVTRVFSSVTPFVFPVGAPTLIPVRAVKYTPATIGFTSDPTTYGSITVIPVGYEHPSVTTNGQSLTYFWRVKSSGFVGIAANSVTHTFIYDQTDVVGTEGNYIPSLWDRTNLTWNSGLATDLNTVTNTISDWSSPTDSRGFLDADYTAGDAAFGTPRKFYSIANSAWNINTTWSYTSGGAAVPAGAVEGTNFPGPNSIVIIENNHTVNLTANQRCASLQIKAGSVLDIYTWSGSTFSMVQNSPGGNGLFRLTTTVTSDWQHPKFFTFPSGDFSDFNANGGTTEFYDIDGRSGILYILPNGVSSYGNLILTAFNGDNLILPNISSVTINGDLTCSGNSNLAWICMSWSTGHNGFIVDNYDPIVEKTVHVKGNLFVNAGTLEFMDEYLPQHLVVDGNVNVGPNGWIDCNTPGGNAPGGPPQANTLAIGGSLINNSLALLGQPGIRFNSSGYYCDVTFQGSTNATISGTSPSTIFNKVIVNKGSSQATTLTLSVGGTLTTLTDNWLTLQNGTFIHNRPGSDFNITTGSPFTIPATAGLTITNANNVHIANANSNTNDLFLSGKLTVINGNVYVGPNPSTGFSNDIEYSSSGASSIDIQGGNLVVNGQIRRNPLNAGGVLKYSQSGGTVTINGQASNGTNAKLEVLNGGSDFTMSNGTLTIVRGNGASTTPSSAFGDLYIRPQTGSITGGTIIFSQGGLNTENYFLDANIPLNNLSITGAAGQPAVVRLLVSPLVLNGDMTINANSVLNANNINITFNGNLINTPGVGGYIYGTNLTTFSGPGAQTITGATDFYDLVVNSGTSLTISNPSTINRNLTLSHGNFTLGANAVSVKGDFQNDAGYLDTDAVGNGIILNGSTLQHITGIGYYSRLTLNNSSGAGIENDITLNEDLTMTSGILDIKKNLVSLSVNSIVQGGPFSAAKMITSDGVFSNVGLRKFFNPGATTFDYPIGTGGKYTPAKLIITASNSVGYVRINNINSRHPAILDPANALDYYWEVQSSGITGFSGNLILNYLQEDVVGDESNYLAARLMVPGTSWDLTPGVDIALNKITTNYVGSNNLSGEYTAGAASAFFGNVPIFTSIADGNWTNPAIWTQTGGDPYVLTGGPNGFIVNINTVVTLNANNCSAYRTTINNELKVVSPYYGHNIGTVDGSGTLYLESGSFPAGVFTAFLGCSNNSTVEYGGSGTYTIIADLYDNISKLVFSGTGVRVLPDKDLTICNQLKIDGPTLDNSVYNHKLIIQGTMERYNTGAFRSGSGAGATVSFAGSVPQTVGGILGDFTGTNAFSNFEISNASGLRVNDAGAIEVINNLLLTSGLINTGSGRSLTITNSAINCVIPSGGSINSFVDGPLIKSISQYDNFLFPIGVYKSGPGNILGNNLNISSTQTGPLLWSAEYKNPNGTSDNVTSPLLGVSAQEYYTIKATAGSQNILNINWTPTSDVNPLITSGISNIRLANYNTGTSKWVEIATTSSGNNSNGTATSTGLVTSTGSDDYTLGSIADLKPRAKLAPVGPVCGAAGIPVTFTSPLGIPFNYTLSYTINGVAQVPVTILPAMIPYTLPTPVPGIYKLTDFTYNSGASIGVVDASSISVFAVPTTSVAGLDQTKCGITTANLAGNVPLVGTGLWSIVSGAGGTLITPASPTSQFIGLNGISYTLRWTISNGTCISTDDVVINFTILPAAPAASPTQNFCGPATIAGLVATPPTGCTVDWYSAASGGVLLPGGTALVNGTTYYAESNGGCVSLTRTPVTVTINPIPLPGLIGSNLVCIGSTGNVYSTEPGKSNYIWSVVGGFISAGGLSTDNTATVTWTTNGPQSISVNYQDIGGCTAIAPTIYNVTVTPLPSPTFTAAPTPVCANSTGKVYTTQLGMSAYVWTVTGGAIT
ncbi:MAG: DUF2341 domain-containing protein, partial [Bacteroidales bacterium]